MASDDALKSDWRVIAYSAIFLAAIGLFWFWSSTTQSESIEPTKEPEIDILFSGRSYPHYDALEPALQQAGFLEWDAVVFGGSTVDAANGQQISQVAEAASDLSSNIEFLAGPKDAGDQYFNGAEGDRYFDTGDVQHIILDTNQNDDCNLNPRQIDFLKEALRQPSEHRVLYTHHSWWVKEEQTPEVFKSQPSLACPESRWFKEVQPLIKDKVDIVVSGDGPGLFSDTFNNVRYVTVGAKAVNTSNLLPFVRLSLIDDTFVVDKFEITDQRRVDTSKLNKLPTYRVEVDPEELHELYQQLPTYDFQKNKWSDLLENEDGAGADELKGEISHKGMTYKGSISTRGSLGNHWEGLKKSWTLEWDLEDGAQRQLKFIMPSDRVYINQLFVQAINDSETLNVISPRQGVARLIINGVDFGPYLTYGDYDKEFIELSQFGSDTDRVGGKFRDLFAFYPAWDDLAFLEKAGPNLPDEDKSLYQKALLFNDKFKDFKNYIDPGNYRDWVASQIFTADFHQNANNNMRLFIDRATGRYIFLSWDQFYGKMDSAEDYLKLHAKSDLQFAILDDPSEEEAINDTVRKLIKEEAIFQSNLTQLEDKYLEVFLNDPFPVHSRPEIKQKIESLQERYEHNMRILKQAF